MVIFLLYFVITTCIILATMETAQKMKIIEEKLGGPVAASRAAGVEYPTWYRWRQANGNQKRIVKVLDLLLEKVNGTPNSTQIREGRHDSDGSPA
jgi:hypothetical protein